MRIVTLKEFLTLPAGTVYARQHEGTFGGFEIKLETVGERKWAYQIAAPFNFSLDESTDYFETLEHLGENPGEETEMDFDEMYVEDPDDRDFYGMLNHEYTYAVYSKQDIQGLIRLFQKYS